MACSYWRQDFTFDNGKFAPGQWYQTWENQGRKGHHRLDPKQYDQYRKQLWAARAKPLNYPGMEIHDWSLGPSQRAGLGTFYLGRASDLNKYSLQAGAGNNNDKYGFPTQQSIYTNRHGGTGTMELMGIASRIPYDPKARIDYPY